MQTRSKLRTRIAREVGSSRRTSTTLDADTVNQCIKRLSPEDALPSWHVYSHDTRNAAESKLLLAELADLDYSLSDSGEAPNFTKDQYSTLLRKLKEARNDG